MMDYDIKIDGASSVKVFGTKDNTVVFPASAKIDMARNKTDVNIGQIGDVVIGLPENCAEIELACKDCRIRIEEISFEEFEIDGKGNLQIEADHIRGKLDINLVSSESVLVLPSDYSFALINKGRNCMAVNNALENADAENVVELNGKDSKLQVRVSA